MIRVEDQEGLRVLVLDRPDKRNALTKGMLGDLLSEVERAGTDTTLRALVLTGTGSVFSAGADLDEARAGLATDPVWNRLSDAIAALPLLTIAALNGPAAGGALGMVLASDIVVAAPSARLFYPVMKLGFLPQSADVERLVARVGPARASLILLAGARPEAEEALSLGLVDRIVEDPMAAAEALCVDAMTARRDHVAAIKAMVRGA